MISTTKTPPVDDLQGGVRIGDIGKNIRERRNVRDRSGLYVSGD